MPATQLAKASLTCPHCGHQQLEPLAVVSSVCKKCGQHFLAEDARKPRRVTREKRARRHLRCFDCGTELEVVPSAQSTMCKRCSRHIDLLDYNIAVAVSKNFKTKGAFVIQPKGYVFNTEAIVGSAVIRGRFLGKLMVEDRLTIYETADIKGSFTAGLLVIPSANLFRWKERIAVKSAEIEGELMSDLRAEGSVVVKRTGRLFGNVESSGLVVETGGVMVGEARIKPPES